MKDLSIAVVGATGLVGSTLLNLLEERSFPFKQINLLASQSSAGKNLTFKGKQHELKNLENFDFSHTNLAFFCVNNELAATYIPKAVEQGAIIIDKSNHYRNHKEVPLIIPEVNLLALKNFKKQNIIASPNCNTIPIAVVLKPIYEKVGIKRINIATYQSVSGSGKEGIVELEEQIKYIVNGHNNKDLTPRIYSQQIAFNVLPHCDDFQENGYTKEEMKMVWEIQKIFEDEQLAINPTAVRVPVICGHAVSLNIETKQKIKMTDAVDLLANAPGIKMLTGKNAYPTPVKDAAGKDEVFVGRIREDISCERGLNLWVTCDNLRKGAALNAVQIAEHLLAQQ